MPSTGPLHYYIPDLVEHEFDPLVDSCCICFHPYNPTLMNPKAEDPVQLACGHIFGISCLEKWARSHSTCPLCRAELDIQNTSDEAMDAFSYAEHFSWQMQVDYDTDINGEYEAEYFDTHEEFRSSRRVRYRADEDLWIAIAYEEELYSLYTPLKPSFPSDIEIFDIALDEHFKELIDCHEQWMGDVFEYEEHDECSLTSFDVLS